MDTGTYLSVKLFSKVAPNDNCQGNRLALECLRKVSFGPLKGSQLSRAAGSSTVATVALHLH